MHTPDCQLRQTQSNQEREAWATRWPAHCPGCEGRGEFSSSYDPSPAGVSLGSGFLQDAEPCVICTEQGLCPRCRKQVWDPEDIPETPCPHCGWNWGKQEGDVMPPKHECSCYEAEMYAAYEREIWSE